MKLRFLSFLPVIALVSACEPKPAADDPEAREREIQRVVEQRLAEERRADQEKELAARDAHLSEREREIKARERETERERQRIADEREAAERAARVASDDAVDRRQPQPVAEQGPAQSYDLFYTSLDSHGDWIELGNYGYVFRPSAARSEAWRPYTNGYWAYSDYGWTWISNEPFGWATYHYGRWTRARGVGWVWVPGEEWAPAWVSWRASDDYVGWAPLPPEAEYGESAGIGGWADSTYDIAPAQYTFVTVNNFSAPIVQNTIIAPQENITIINKTVNVTNIKTRNSVVINEGPSFNTIKARSGRNIQKLTIERARGGGGAATVVKGDRIQISAPVIKRRGADTKPARIKERVQNVAIETGWSDVSDPQAARQLRQKMNTDAVTAKAAPADRPPAEPRQQQQNASQQPPPVLPPASTPAAAADPGRTQREAAREAREQQLRQQRENARQAAAEQRERRRETPPPPAQPNQPLTTPTTPVAATSPAPSIRQPSAPAAPRGPGDVPPPLQPDAEAARKSAAAAEARQLQQAEAQKQRQEQQQQQRAAEQRREAAQAARKQQQEAGEKEQSAGAQRRQQAAEAARELNRRAPVASPAPVALPVASPAS